MGPRSGQRREVGQRIERKIHLGRRSAELVPTNVRGEVVGQHAGIEKSLEGESGVNARGHDGPADLVAVFEDDPLGAIAADMNAANRRLRPDLDASGEGGAGNRVRDGTGSAAGQSPRAEGAVDFAHVVVQQDIGGAW